MKHLKELDIPIIMTIHLIDDEILKYIDELFIVKQCDTETKIFKCNFSYMVNLENEEKIKITTTNEYIKIMTGNDHSNLTH